MPGDTLYTLCYNWAQQPIEYYDYEEDGLEFTERDNPADEYYDDYTESD